MSNSTVILFSAGANINKGVEEHPRIEEEVESLKPLISNHSRIVIFNHQGDYHKGTAEQTPWLAPLFSAKLQYPVHYFEQTVGPAAMHYVSQCLPGTVTIMGNTRLYPGEQMNDTAFASELAALGGRLVIGGFCKLHRDNASNCAIKNFTQWRYSAGVLSQLEKLERLYTELFQHKKTVLLLGGNKKEKLQFLFNHTRLPFVDRVILGGAALNSVLHAMGIPIGRSEYFPISLNSNSSLRVYIPEIVIVKNTDGMLVRRNIYEVRETDSIVDFLFDSNFLNDITHSDEYAFFAAGPLSSQQSQYAHLAYRILQKKHITGLFMGGDTLSEVDTFSYCSSGGGAALHFFSYGY